MKKHIKMTLAIVFTFICMNFTFVGTISALEKDTMNNKKDMSLYILDVSNEEQDNLEKKSPDNATCKTILGGVGTPEKPTLLYWLKNFYILMEIAGSIVFVVFTSLEFAKAVASSDEKALSKAGKKTISRLIALMVLFLLPLLIEFILEILMFAGVKEVVGFCLKF